MKLKMLRIVDSVRRELKDLYLSFSGNREYFTPEEKQKISEDKAILWKRRAARWKVSDKSVEDKREFLKQVLYRDYRKYPSLKLAEFAIKFCKKNFDANHDFKLLLRDLTPIWSTIFSLPESQRDDVALCVYNYFHEKMEALKSEDVDNTNASFDEIFIDCIVKNLSADSSASVRIPDKEKAENAQDQKSAKTTFPESKTGARLLKDILKEAESIDGQRTVEQINDAIRLSRLFGIVANKKPADFDGRVHVRFLPDRKVLTPIDTLCIFNAKSGAKPVFFGRGHLFGPVDEVREYLRKELERQDNLNNPVDSQPFAGKLREALEGSKSKDARDLLKRVLQITADEHEQLTPLGDALAKDYHSALKFIDEVCPPAA